MLDRWEAGALDEVHDAEVRGESVTLFRLAEMPFDEMKAFFDAQNESESAEEETYGSETA